jgi:hypothetical protein
MCFQQYYPISMGEIGEYTRDVSRQQLSKHVPAAMNQRATIEVLLETGYFYVVHAEELS